MKFRANRNFESVAEPKLLLRFWSKFEQSRARNDQITVGRRTKRKRLCIKLDTENEWKICTSPYFYP